MENVVLNIESYKNTNSLSQKVYEKIKFELLTCKLSPGNEVHENELTKRFKVSRTPVREALARLEFEGFVESIPRRCYRITPITFKYINEIFSIRSALEGLSSSLASTKIQQTEIEELEKICDTTYEIDKQGTILSFVNENIAFHSIIARSSGNIRLSKLIENYLGLSERLFYMGAKAKDVNPETRNDHQEIIKFIKSGNSEKASASMTKHIENTRKHLLFSIIESNNLNLN